MVYFIHTFRVQVFICTLILIASSKSPKASATAGTEHLIADFLQKFIKPFLRSTVLRSNPTGNVTMKPELDTKISKLIKRKLTELKPLVQDDDEMIETEDNLTLHGNEETTLIEFLPRTSRKNKDGSERSILIKPIKPDPLKNSIKRYKILREQIKVMLDEEKITESTKTLILTTLDEIIAKLIESQCTWMPDRKLTMFRNDTNDSISKLRSMTKKQWKNLRHQYMDYLTNRKEKENAFMNQFHHFFSSVFNDTYNLSERYRIRCQLVQLNNNKQHKHKTVLREKKEIEKSKCENFKLCSTELREFFIDFYNYVNDTAVSVFKNYASMYMRDVNIDFGVDKEFVANLVNSLGDKAERKVIKVYKNELHQFKLDPDKNKNANIKHIRDFIGGVVTMTTSILNASLAKDLGIIKSKLFMTVKEDLAVNLDVDLENLERHYTDLICTMFVLCNGRYSTRRSGEAWTFRPRSNSEVFVKVQLSLDEEMKEMVARSGFLEYFKRPTHVKYKINKDSRRSIIMNVTRTSITTLNITRTQKLISNTAVPNSIINNGSQVPKLTMPKIIDVKENTT